MQPAHMPPSFEATHKNFFIKFSSIGLSIRSMIREILKEPIPGDTLPLFVYDDPQTSTFPFSWTCHFWQPLLFCEHPDRTP